MSLICWERFPNSLSTERSSFLENSPLEIASIDFDKASYFSLNILNINKPAPTDKPIANGITIKYRQLLSIKNPNINEIKIISVDKTDRKIGSLAFSFIVTYSLILNFILFYNFKIKEYVTMK